MLGLIAPRVTTLRLEIDPCSMNQRQALAEVVHFSSLKTLALQVWEGRERGGGRLD